MSEKVPGSLEVSLWARFSPAAATLLSRPKCKNAILKSFDISGAGSSGLFSSSFRADMSDKTMERQSPNLKAALSLSLGRFHISEDYGFLLPNPLVSMEPLIRSE